MLFLLLLFLIPNIICHQDYQTIPLRYEAAIDYLQHIQQSNFIHRLDDVETYSITSDKMSSYISLISNNEATQCENDFETMIKALLKRDMWALKIFDAWGKPLPSGLLKGNAYWVGDYDECLNPMYLPNNKTFVSQKIDTQYCSFSSPPISQPVSPHFSISVSLFFGFCIPSSCNGQDVLSLIHTLLNKTHVTEYDVICSNDPPNGQKGLTNGAIITIVILSLLGLLVLIGTIIDLILMSRLDTIGNINANIDGHDSVVDGATTQSISINTPQYSRYSIQTLIDITPRTIFLAEFSALKTLRRIFTMKQKNDDESYLFINGIRVLSLFVVIIVHSFGLGLTYSTNPQDVLTLADTTAIQLLVNVIIPVDTFFLISGFLTAILFVRQVKKEKKLSFRFMFLYYIHRYIRLTPAFLLMILVSINLTQYFGHGPVYPSQQGFEVPQCPAQYWWTSILYVGNIVKPDYMCLPVSWYLHNDMQFHWIAPLALIPFVLGRKTFSYFITILFVFIGIISIATTLLYYPQIPLDLISLILTGPGPTFFKNVFSIKPGPSFFKNVFITPWCRISSYAIGIITGYCVINVGRQYRMNKCIKFFITIFMILICLAFIFMTNPDYLLTPGLERLILIAYQSLSRTLWSMFIGWILFLCSTNQGGIVNEFLSWPIWAPLARLNYSCYLVNYTIISVILFSRKMPIYNQALPLVNTFVSHIFFSYAAAILVAIFFETPFFIIEKKIFKR